ncbi:histidine triad nucleotide-binding protein [Microbulbifer flavimaris]|uniref:Histidine triad nucleotide-binding protein n=1 Tax=Microbulbifer flavimaris TaxID=1781068 RepID=A0ABX4HY16_9GAMM|nr:MULTISPECIES: histidine triad nucleotide-binding protein [Microbulbifer]KUJ81675.1 histidine triad nucleotide-binding protein [Microbulbifer sp. ZGT114]PCO04592.1 histidine triad nucleotide-binding protein [Microbulbifer flavimaris]
MSKPSVFSRIIAGEVEADRVFEDEQCIVIRDRAPKAPTHLLIIPKKPLVNLLDAGAEDKPLLGHLLWVAAEMGRRLELDGYRLVMNNGPDAGQTVFHMHIHLLANRKMREQDLAE